MVCLTTLLIQLMLQNKLFVFLSLLQRAFDPGISLKYQTDCSFITLVTFICQADSSNDRQLLFFIQLLLLGCANPLIKSEETDT